MNFNFSRKYDFPPEYTIGASNILKEVSTLKILGIEISSNLRWHAQVKRMITKASSKIWILRRMKQLGVDEVTLADYWAKEGRVHLELACPVWHSGLTVHQSADIERTQRIAVAAIRGWQSSYEDSLRALGLPLLSERRDKLCLKFAQRTATKSRHKDLFELQTYPYNTRRKNIYKVPFCRTKRYYKSAKPYLCRLLNSAQPV